MGKTYLSQTIKGPGAILFRIDSAVHCKIYTYSKTDYLKETKIVTYFTCISEEQTSCSI